jgi:hypothetical protein
VCALSFDATAEAMYGLNPAPAPSQVPGKRAATPVAPSNEGAARYFSSTFRPAFKLSKFRMVFSTKEYVPRVSPR